MTEDQRQYLSYLLRIWHEHAGLEAVWRASLEDPQTGERLGFAGIVQLFEFVQKQLSVETSREIPRRTASRRVMRGANTLDGQRSPNPERPNDDYRDR